MSSQRSQHIRQRSVRSRQESDGNMAEQRSIHATPAEPQATPGVLLPQHTSAVDNRFEGVTALDFALMARQLTAAAQTQGVDCPSFRSPPDLPGISRSIRRNQDNSITVAVVVRGRYRLAVSADMIEGVVASTSLEFAEASRLRDALWLSISADTVAAPTQVELSNDRTNIDATSEIASKPTTEESAQIMVSPVAA